MIKRHLQWLVAVLMMLGAMLAHAQATTPQPDLHSVNKSTLQAASRTPGDEAAVEYGRVGYASLTGPIDHLRQRYLERVVDAARKAKLDTLVLHIDTDGGKVSNAREMFKKVVAQKRDGPRMIAYVDFRAISAGAMVSYAHEQIFISPEASIGDIGVIFISREGEIKYAPEKIETVVRSMLTQAAELRGWDRALLLKMTARTQKLYHVTLPDGEKRYVIEDDLPALLAAHPEIDPDNRKHVYVHRGDDRLLTLTGQEAVTLGMATGIAGTKEELFAKLGVDEAEVTDLTPRLSELTAWSLATFAPILAGLAMLFLLFELKTPGVGLWALLAALFGAGFLLSQYYLDMAENLEVVLMLVGVTLLALEVMLGIGGGLLAIVGGGVAFVGLLMSFIPNQLPLDLRDDAFREALQQAAISSFISIGVVVVGIVLLVSLLPKMRVQSRFAVMAEVSGTSAGAVEADDSVVVGKRGICKEILRPSGLVEVGDHAYSARALHGKFIEAGRAIRVEAVEFGELVVVEVES